MTSTAMVALSVTFMTKMHSASTRNTRSRQSSRSPLRTSEPSAAPAWRRVAAAVGWAPA